MKKLILNLIFSSIVLTSFGQKETISMEPILRDGFEYINLIEREYGQEIVRMEFDLLFTTKETFRSLSSDYEYGIIAFGDYKIKDIDIKVYKYVNEQWILIKEDNEINSYAMVMIKPPFTANYLIEIKAYEFEPGYDRGHYGLIIFHP